MRWGGGGVAELEAVVWKAGGTGGLVWLVMEKLVGVLRLVRMEGA